MDEAAGERRGARQHKLLYRFDLLLDYGQVTRRVLGQPGDLRSDQATKRQDQRQGRQDSNHHRWNATEMSSPQQVHERREQERQQHCKGQRDQYRPAEIEPGNQDERDSNGQQAAQAGVFGRRDLDGGAVRSGRKIQKQGSFRPVARASLMGRVKLTWSFREGRPGRQRRLAGDLGRSQARAGGTRGVHAVLPIAPAIQPGLRLRHGGCPRPRAQITTDPKSRPTPSHDRRWRLRSARLPSGRVRQRPPQIRPKAAAGSQAGRASTGRTTSVHIQGAEIRSTADRITSSIVWSISSSASPSGMPGGPISATATAPTSSAADRIARMRCVIT